uniref:Rho guanine nucleotide exchange factor 39 n=1 Tax=Anas platyrhynchos platyrhynchos TaxID=8840 RepID=A0A493T3J4_ANAPP
MSGSPLLLMAGADVVEEQRARWERKRSRTAKELLETEHKYLKQLDLVITFFVTILKAKGTLKPAVMETIFGPLESIYSASQVLSLHLERGNLGLGLENFCQKLELYGHYAENLEQANKTLKEQLRKNKSFRRFKKLQETRPQFQGKKLEDLLPLPLQRLQQENSLQLLRVQKLLKGRKTQLLTAGRWYIREGWLLVVPSKGKELKRRMFFLFSDIFVATKPCHPLHLLNSNKFACTAVYPLHQCEVDKVFGHTQSQGGLLSLSFPHKTLLLMSSDQQDVNDWYQSLKAAVSAEKNIFQAL